MKSTLIAVDVAKEVFEVAVSERPGRVTQRHRLSRVGFGRFLAQQAAGTIVMEAFGTAHFWSRQAQASGHQVILLPAHAVQQDSIATSFLNDRAASFRPSTVVR